MKTRIFLLFTAVFVMPCLGASLPEPEDLTFEPIQFNPLQPVHETLPNGLDLWMIEDSALPIVSVVIDVGVGNEMDPDNRFGLAEFTTRMLIQGGSANTSPEDVDDLLDTYAIRLSAASDSNSSQIRLWCMSEDLDTALPLLGELILSPAFENTRQGMLKEKIAAEIRQMKDFPFFEAIHHFSMLMYGEKHPNARLPSEEELSLVTRDDMVQFHARYFKPDITRIGIVGDFKDSDMLKRMSAIFGQWSGCASDWVKVQPPDPEAESNTVYIVDKPGTQAALMLGHIGLPANNPFHYELRMFDRIFGAGGFSSRLMQQVRTEHGYAYMVFGGFRDSIPVGLFQVGCQTQTTTAEDAVTLILDIIKELQTHPVTQEELTLAKTATENSFVFNFERPASLIQQLFRFQTMGFKANYLDTYLDRIQKVTSADILKAAQQSISRDKLIVVAVGPAEELKEEFTPLGWPVKVIK
jgi:zinc protease